MAITLPIGVRVAVGVLGTAFDRLGKLPENLPAIGVSLVGQAFRTSLRVRQEIAELAVRGDELLAGITGGAQEHPAWATFDEDDGDAADPADGFPSTGGTGTDWTGGLRPDMGEPGDDHYGDFGHEPSDFEVVLLEATVPAAVDPLEAVVVAVADPLEPTPSAAVDVLESAPISVADPLEPIPSAFAARRRSTAPSAAATSDEPMAAPEHRAAAAKRAAANARTAAAVRRSAAARAAGAAGPQAASRPEATSGRGRTRARVHDPDKAAIVDRPAVEDVDHPAVGDGTEPSGLAVQTSSGVSLLEGVQDFSVAELKERMQSLDVTSVQELLREEEAGPQRAAYLTLLTNRLTTLEHENG